MSWRKKGREKREGLKGKHGALKRQSKIKVQRWFFIFQWRNRERERE